MTDVTNASRTMLMNIHTLQWDPELCKYVLVYIYTSCLSPFINSVMEIKRKREREREREREGCT